MKLSDVVATIETTHKNAIPLYLWGAPGIGKTAIVSAAARALGVKLITLRVNLLEPVDFLGLPKPTDDGRVTWIVPDFVPEDGTTGILFLDEFAQAPLATQCAAMRLVDNLPAGWQVIAASNRATDRAGAGQVATHVLSRFSHLDIDVSREDWQSWASANGIAPEIRAFIDFRPGLLFAFDAKQSQADRANCSPRAWERASKILKTVPSAMLLEILTGTVGAGPAAELIGYLQICKQCPNVDEIVNSPQSVNIPREPSAVYAVCASLADRARTCNPQQIAKIAEYLVRLPVEFGALLITDLLAINPTIITLPSIGRWIGDNKTLFAQPRA